MWKREFMVVRIEDRLPVDVNPAVDNLREWGEELRIIQTWLRNRGKVTGKEEGWKGRFDIEKPAV